MAEGKAFLHKSKFIKYNLSWLCFELYSFQSLDLNYASQSLFESFQSNLDILLLLFTKLLNT